MSLIDETKKLRELEQQATPGKWYKAERDEGDCDEINGRTQSWDTGVMVYDREMGVFHPENVKVRFGPEEFEDEMDLESICAPDKKSNAEFIAMSRNLAPAMLEVLGMIREGDADTLDELLSDWVYSEQHPAVEVLNRLQKMAALMGNDEATAALVRERII